ncbi:hypothetical protein M413DRAFT_145372 [Hebeloma cylindrosporum]|uniref:Uncharacterized protein n=1 Tax=Hebeloma cylindrosporum TaxID=76867 RepID=A0A0C2YJR1_HEBCY|nr:hypothetical protein M413DRAFT_145372 [Hebeloma cylindrosporum h7]
MYKYHMRCIPLQLFYEFHKTNQVIPPVPVKLHRMEVFRYHTVLDRKYISRSHLSRQKAGLLRRLPSGIHLCV